MSMLDRRTRTATSQAGFDLTGFGRAIERADLDYLTSAYADDAEVRVVDRDSPPLAPRVVRGRQAICDWLAETRPNCTRRVVHLSQGHGRISYTEEREHLDGSHETSASTAQLRGGLIRLQHTVVVWDDWR
jgi:ketosteroid isomerase-like protein